MGFDPLAFLNSMRNPAPASPAPDPAAVAAAKAALAAQLPKAPAAPMLTGQAAQSYAKAAGIGPIPPGAGILPGIVPPDAPAPGATGPVADPIPPVQLATLSPAIQAAHAEVFGQLAASAPVPEIAEPVKPRRGRPRKAAETATATAPTGTEVETSGDELHVYVDCAVDGIETKSLEPYVHELLDKLCEVFKVPDIRTAPNHLPDGGDSPLGFGKWRGTLSAYAKASPPPPGAYRIAVEGSELRQAVLEGLRPKCTVYVRGVR